MIRPFAQYDASAFHPVTRVFAGLAQDQYSTGNHAGATEVSCVTADHDHSAPHFITGPVSGVAPYRDQAVPHSVHAGAGPCPDIIAGIALDIDPAPVHIATEPVATTAVNPDCSASHLMAEVTAAMGLDADMSPRHLCAYPGNQFRSTA